MGLRVEEPASLKALNSFGVDARADRLVTLEDPADLDAALAELARAPRALVLGGGSNLLLVGDFHGTALRVALRGRRIVAEEGDGVVVEAAAGENWHDFVCWSLEQGLSGLENLALIPGTVGASPIQNIGAYGVEMCERFDSLEAVDRRNGRRHRLFAADCRFAYRDSVFKHPEGEHWLVLSVRLRLSRRFEPRLDYQELRSELAGRTPDARAIADAVAAIRRRKLPDPSVLGNAGSFFRNPVVDAAHAAALARQHPGMPRHPEAHRLPQTPLCPAASRDCADGDAGPALPRTKLSAGWLIEHCGWKGFRDGDAGVHSRHALVLVNHGSASGAQLLELAERIRESVRERFGVELEPEPAIVQ